MLNDDQVPKDAVKRDVHKPNSIDETRRPTLSRPKVQNTLFNGWGPKL